MLNWYQLVNSPCWIILIGDITLLLGYIPSLLLVRSFTPLGSKPLAVIQFSPFSMVSINWKSPCSHHRYPGGQPSFRVPGGRFLRRSRDQHLMDWTGFVLLLGGAYGLRGCCVRGAPVETVYQVAGYHGCKNGDAIL